MESTANICFDCENACGRCSWSRDFTPVPGWTAIPITQRSAHNENIDTYKITACPLFERTPPRKHVDSEWRSITAKEGRARHENRHY